MGIFDLSSFHLDWFHRWLGGEPAPYDIRELARNRALLVKEDTPEEDRQPEGPGSP